jgi:hypothetical protein
MLVPDAKQTFRVVVPRQLLTTMSKAQQGCVIVALGESGGAGLMAKVQLAFPGSLESPPGPDKSTIVFPKFE